MDASLLPFASNAQIEAEKAEAVRRDAEQSNSSPVISGMAGHVRKCFDAARSAKDDMITERLLQCARQRRGEYDPGDLAVISKSGGAEIYMMITSIKCRTIEAIVRDVLLPLGERPWDLDATPIPELPESVEQTVQGQVEQELQMVLSQAPGTQITPEDIKARVQELIESARQEQKDHAQAVADYQATVVDDIMTEGKFYDELATFSKDFATYPTAFMKGPTVEFCKDTAWEDAPDGSGKKMVVTEVPKRVYRCISPFDIYPSPGARSLHDGYLVERMRVRRRALRAMIGTHGFKESSVLAVLELYPDGYRDWFTGDQDRADVESRTNEETDPEAMFDVLVFNGSIQGSDLIDFGMSRSEVGDPLAEYDAVVWVIDSWVLMARLNPHPLGLRPYHCASYDGVNGSIWGTAPPEMMRDSQKMCNHAARAIADNMSLASGPMLEVQKDRLSPGETVDDIYPWRIINTESEKSGGGRPAVYFYQPNMLAVELMRVFDRFFLQAGEQIGIPAYEHGSTQTRGAGETATGLSMLMKATSRVSQDAIKNIDNGVVKGVVYQTWLSVALVEGFEDVGDVKVVAVASERLMLMEQLNQLRMDWLIATNNPTDLQIVGIPGRAEVLRESAKRLRMPIDKIMPTRAQITQQLAAAQQAQMAAQEQQNAAAIAGQNAGGAQAA